jgi:hypothetical protein
LYMRDLLFDANGGAQNALHITQSDGSIFENIEARNSTVTGILVTASTSDTWINPTVSANIAPFTTVPQYGMRFEGPNGGVTVIGMKLEGVSSHGLYLDNIITSSFIGGTSEGNGGDGIYCYYTCADNKFIGQDFEANGGYDIESHGNTNMWAPTVALSTSGSLIAESARFNEVTGGLWSQITVAANAFLTTIHDLTLTTGPIADAGSGTQWHDLKNPTFTGSTYNYWPQKLANHGGNTEINGIVALNGVTALQNNTFLSGTVVAGGVNLWPYSDPTLPQLPLGQSSTLQQGTGVGGYYGLQNGAKFPAAAELDYGYTGVAITSGAHYVLSAYCLMNSGGAPVPGGSTSGYDFIFAITDATPEAPGYVVTNVSGNVYRVSLNIVATATATMTVGPYRYATNSGNGFSCSGFQVNTGTTLTAYSATSSTINTTPAAVELYALTVDTPILGTAPTQAPNDNTTKLATTGQAFSTFNNWVQTTPTVSCGTGTPTAVTSVLNTEVAAKTAFFNFTITVTTIGSCNGVFTFPIPFTPAAGSVFSCAELGNSGDIGLGVLYSGSAHVASITNATGGGFATNGDLVICSGTAQTQ